MSPRMPPVSRRRPQPRGTSPPPSPGPKTVTSLCVCSIILCIFVVDSHAMYLLICVNRRFCALRRQHWRPSWLPGHISPRIRCGRVFGCANDFMPYPYIQSQALLANEAGDQTGGGRDLQWRRLQASSLISDDLVVTAINTCPSHPSLIVAAMGPRNVCPPKG